MILLTGANGFIGRHVVKQLLYAGSEVAVIVRNKEKYNQIGNEIVIQGNLNECDKIKNCLKNYDFDACIHLAWEGIPNYSYDMSKKNLVMGLNLLDLCRDLEIKRIVITGSCWEYNNPVGAVSVDNEMDFSNEFKIAKNSFHMLSAKFAESHGVELIWLRLFYVYGPGQREGSLIPYILKTIRQKEKLKLNGAYNRNDFVFVGDVANVISYCAINGCSDRIVNVGKGESTLVLDIAVKIGKILGITIENYPFERYGNEKNYYADVDEIPDEIRCLIKTDLESGIKQMV